MEERLEKVEAMLVKLALRHEEAQDDIRDLRAEVRNLLRAQIMQQETMGKLALKSRETEERLDALIRTFADRASNRN